MFAHENIAYIKVILQFSSFTTGSFSAFFLPMLVMVNSYVLTVRLLSQKAKFYQNAIIEGRKEPTEGQTIDDTNSADKNGHDQGNWSHTYNILAEQTILHVFFLRSYFLLKHKIRATEPQSEQSVSVLTRLPGLRDQPTVVVFYADRHRVTIKIKLSSCVQTRAQVTS